VKSSRWLPFATLLTLGSFGQSVSPSAASATLKQPVVDSYYGISVSDDYRWLENWDDPVVKNWTAEQNSRTREYFKHLPGRAYIKARIGQLIASRPPTYSYLQFRGGMWFALKHQPDLQQAVLVAISSPSDPSDTKVIFDPNRARLKGASIDFFIPSFGGKYVAVAISSNGSEDASARVFEVASGKELHDVVPRVNFATAGGSMAWKADSSGFYYTRYPHPGERPPQDSFFYQQIYFHKLGTDARGDSYVLGSDFPRIAETQLRSSPDGKWLLASVGYGDGGRFAHYLMNAQGQWTQLARFEDQIVQVHFGPDAMLYLLSRKDAPGGKIVRMPLSNPELTQARVIVPESPGGAKEEDWASIENFVPTSDRLYVIDSVGGPSRVRAFTKDGEPLRGPVLPPLSAIVQAVPAGRDLLLYVSTFLSPPTLYRFDALTGKTKVVALPPSSMTLDGAEVAREFVPSKDGTRIPINIIHRKGISLDGTHPVLLTGYGGYGINTKPDFQGPFARLWLDAGGIFVDTNIRGGAEYGDEWHQAGKLTRKQNVFDDFIACAQYLIGKRYTNANRLAIMGGSNGGLLMGAAFTQRPDLFRAVVSSVGIYDMLRVEQDPNGAFNVPEFGSTEDREQFAALFEYSPYHHVKNGTRYPALLMLTGDNDHRVNPMQSRKMIAQLQAADGSGRPILLRTTPSAGHGIGTPLNETIDQQADIVSFLFDQLGMEYE